MKAKKSINFFFAVITIIVGWTLYKQFNFETLQFENTALAIVYAATLIISVTLLIKNYRNQPEI